METSNVNIKNWKSLIKPSKLDIKLNDDKSNMFGINSFIDYDLEGHTRGSVGFELKGAMLDLTTNNYFDQKT